MKFRTTSAVLAGALAMGVAGQLNANPDLYTDATGDVAGGIFNPNGILDLVSLEVSNTATDVVFTLTVNSGASFNPDWGKYMIGIAGGGTSANGNGWGRPINMVAPNGGMTRWIGSWVDGGGAAQVWSAASGAWAETNATYSGNFGGFVISGNTVTYTVSLASLGLNLGDTFYFDAYSSGGGSPDGAIDALANSGQSVANWGDAYTSTGTNLFAYTVVPAPAALAVLGAFGLVRGRRSRKG